MKHKPLCRSFFFLLKLSQCARSTRRSSSLCNWRSSWELKRPEHCSVVKLQRSIWMCKCSWVFCPVIVARLEENVYLFSFQLDSWVRKLEIKKIVGQYLNEIVCLSRFRVIAQNCMLKRPAFFAYSQHNTNVIGKSKTVHLRPKLILQSSLFRVHYYTPPDDNVAWCVGLWKQAGSHAFFSSASPLSRLEQQSVHAKEATEDMEVAILKTCQSVNDLRREVSSGLSLLCLSGLWVWVDVLSFREPQTRLGCLSQDALPLQLVFFFPSLLSFACHLVSLCHLCYSSSNPPSSMPLTHLSFSRVASPLLPPCPIRQFNLWFLLQLHKVAVGRASDLLKVHGEQLPLRALKAAGAEGNLEAVAEYSRTLTEQKEQLVEVGWGQGGWERFLVVVPPSRSVVKKK